MADKMTPGPWKFGTLSACVVDARGRLIADLSERHDAEADGQAIALVPEMVEALRDLVRMNFGQPSGVTVPALDPARALLARLDPVVPSP